MMDANTNIVRGLSVLPSSSPLESGFTISAQIPLTCGSEFSARAAFILDIAVSKERIELGEVSCVVKSNSETVLEISIPDMDLSTVPKRLRNNAALLSLALVVDGKDCGEVNLIASVDERDGVLYKTIFSPFC